MKYIALIRVTNTYVHWLYFLACRIFKISQFNIFKQSNITYFSIIFNTLHNYNYQDERTQGEQGIRAIPEIIYLTCFLKSFWMLYIDQIIVYNTFYSKLTFYIIKDRCQMHTLKVFRSPVWLLLHKLSSPHYRYIRKMRRGDRLPLTQLIYT